MKIALTILITYLLIGIIQFFIYKNKIKKEIKRLLNDLEDIELKPRISFDFRTTLILVFTLPFTTLFGDDSDGV